MVSVPSCVKIVRALRKLSARKNTQHTSTKWNVKNVPSQPRHAGKLVAFGCRLFQNRVTANAAPISKTWGLSAGVLTLATTLSPLANGASRIFWGWASDRIGREMAMIVAFSLQAVCLALVVVLGPTSPFWFSTTLVLVYFTWGEIYSLFPSASADYFGARHATSNYAVLYTAKGVATAIGALGLGAFLYEQTGSWATGFYISAVMALVAAVLAVGLRASQATANAKSSKVPVPA